MAFELEKWLSLTTTATTATHTDYRVRMRKSATTKAEILQLNHTQFICQIKFTNKQARKGF